MTPLTVYVAGPISGITDFLERFQEGQMEVASLGHLPVNPLEVCKKLVGGHHTWLDFMRADIRALLECDGIYCLRDWHQSRGARIEHFIAENLGMVVLYQPEKEN